MKSMKIIKGLKDNIDEIPLIYFKGLMLVSFLILFSCNDSGKEKEIKTFEFEKENWKSIRSTQLINSINYSATEVPLHYYLLKNLGNNSALIDSILEENKEERIVEIEFQHVDQTDLLEQKHTHKSFEDAVKYMSFSIKKDFMVVTSSRDTIKCAGVNFERNFKIAPFKRVLLYFNGISPDESISLIYQDNLFGNDIIKFNLNETPIKL